MPGAPRDPVASQKFGEGRFGDDPAPTADPFDPLKLCIFATVSLLTWVFGPVAVAVFAALGLAGYVKARRAGLTRSKCYLRDTRLVLTYLGVLLLAALAATAHRLWEWVGPSLT
jgi:hypothetical protein